jgi:outer membrane protein OmpA-like peptidoglycan-associated protein
MRRVDWGIWFGAWGLAACSASVPPPRAAEASSAAAVSSARRAGAVHDPRALLHLELAEEQLENGRALMRDGDNRVAAQVLARAKAEADVAASLARDKPVEPPRPPPAVPKAIGGGPPEATAEAALGLAASTAAESEKQVVAEKSTPANEEKAAREALDKIAISSVGTVRIDDRGTIICIPAASLFDGDATSLSTAARDRLGLVIEALAHSDGHAIVVEGYTSSGDAAQNRALAQRRADAVRDLLVARGVPAERIRAQGVGAVRPIADNETVRGRMRNHRIEIVVQPVVETSQAGPKGRAD